MGRARRLSLQEQAQIDVMRQLNLSVNKMATTLSRSRCVIANYLVDPIRYGTKTSGGRPRKLTSRNEREIGRKSSNSTSSAADIKSDLNLHVSKKTILRSIHRNPHLKRQNMMKAPTLTAAHHQARIDFARNNMARDWTMVVFFT